MLLEWPGDFQKSRLGYPLTQNFLAAKIANQVERDTAQGRAEGGHNDVKNKTPAVLVHVPDHDGVHASDGEYAPHSERLKQRPDPRRVARQNMSNSFQRELILSECFERMLA